MFRDVRNGVNDCSVYAIQTLLRWRKPHKGYITGDVKMSFTKEAFRQFDYYKTAVPLGA
jgi:hypothetical protein